MYRYIYIYIYIYVYIVSTRLKLAIIGYVAGSSRGELLGSLVGEIVVSFPEWTNTPGLHNKIPAWKTFARGWVAQEPICS